jgi:hypothetical protein
MAVAACSICSSRIAPNASSRRFAPQPHSALAAARPAGVSDRDSLVAGLTAAVVSALPSSIIALASGMDPFQATLAAGSIVLPHETRRHRLVAAAVPVHLALSLGWASVLSRTLPRRRTAVAGAFAGLGIAVLDLGVVGRRFRRIRALPLLPQLADHVTYGATVGWVLARRR